jgi:5'-3' exonuclease
VGWAARTLARLAGCRPVLFCRLQRTNVYLYFASRLLREYFELEFANVKLPFALEVERVVDDFVLMCMLVGNDFLPRE